MNDCLYDSKNDFLLYELSPGQSVGDQVIWPVQNYYLHLIDFSPDQSGDGLGLCPFQDE